MNKKKIINISQIALQLLALLFMFTGTLAYYEEEEHYTDQWVSGGKHINASSGGINFSNIYDGDSLFVMIFIVLVVISIVMCIISFARKNHKDNIMHALLSLLNFGYSCYILLGGAYRAEGSYTTLHFTDITIAPIANVIIVLFFVVAILGFVKRSKMIVPTEETQPQQIINNIQETSNADELKKYKDLLDNGAITQEEFEAKKKQLLEL